MKVKQKHKVSKQPLVERCHVTLGSAGDLCYSENTLHRWELTRKTTIASSHDCVGFITGPFHFIILETPPQESIFVKVLAPCGITWIDKYDMIDCLSQGDVNEQTY